MLCYRYSLAGMRLTKSFEGCRLKAYQDCRGIWTIAYGHTGPEVHAGLEITQQQADQLLIADMHAACAVVNSHVRVSILQRHFDSLVDFAYNAGIGAFATSRLLDKLNQADFNGAASEFAYWVHAGGVVVEGLVRRRAAEAAMFRGEAA